MASNVKKRVAKACREGRTAHQQYGRVSAVLHRRLFAGVPNLLGLRLGITDVQIGVPVPQACGDCEYRREDMRGDGWCYMFREMPSGLCASFKAEGK